MSGSQYNLQRTFCIAKRHLPNVSQFLLTVYMLTCDESKLIQYKLSIKVSFSSFFQSPHKGEDELSSSLSASMTGGLPCNKKEANIVLQIYGIAKLGT